MRFDLQAQAIDPGTPHAPNGVLAISVTIAQFEDPITAASILNTVNDRHDLRTLADLVAVLAGALTGLRTHTVYEPLVARPVPPDKVPQLRSNRGRLQTPASPVPDPGEQPVTVAQLMEVLRLLQQQSKPPEPAPDPEPAPAPEPAPEPVDPHQLIPPGTPEGPPPPDSQNWSPDGQD